MRYKEGMDASLGLALALALAIVWALTALLDLLHAQWHRRRELRARRREHALVPPNGTEDKEPARSHANLAKLAEPAPAVPSSAAPGTAIVLRARRARLPIVFAHGYFGFDALGLPRRPEYFRGVRAALEAAGHTVHLARVSPTAGIATRAAELAAQIRDVVREGGSRVNIIAHSMGGLDARYAISALGLGTEVASLTTVGTPHQGTPLADTGAGVLGDLQATRRLLTALGANFDGLCDLTTEKMAAFNRTVQDHPAVHYASIVGSVNHRLLPVNALLAPGYAFLWRRAGANDGLVPAASQRWGEVLDEVDADHWAQIGWSGSFDAQALYASVAEMLAARGL